MRRFCAHIPGVQKYRFPGLAVNVLDNARVALLSLWTSRTHRSLFPLDALYPLRSALAHIAFLALDALRPFAAGVTFRSSRSHVAGCTLRPLWSLRTLRSLQAAYGVPLLGIHVPQVHNVIGLTANGVGIALIAGGVRCFQKGQAVIAPQHHKAAAVRTALALRSLRSGWSCRAGRSRGTCQPLHAARALYTLRSGGANVALCARWPLGAHRALRACVSLVALLHRDLGHTANVLDICAQKLHPASLRYGFAIAVQNQVSAAAGCLPGFSVRAGFQYPVCVQAQVQHISAALYGNFQVHIVQRVNQLVDLRRQQLFCGFLKFGFHCTGA